MKKHASDLTIEELKAFGVDAVRQAMAENEEFEKLAAKKAKLHPTNAIKSNQRGRAKVV